MKAKVIMAFLFTVLSVTLMVTMASAATLDITSVTIDDIITNENSTPGC